MKFKPTNIQGVILVEPAVHGDERGFFFESFHALRYREGGIAGPFVQDNLVMSERHVLRGLHLQNPHGQGKLVQALEGEIFDAAVDVRWGSPTFGKWFGAILSATDHRQIYVPPEFAHGYVVVSDGALVSYKTTDFYTPDAELAAADGAIVVALAASPALLTAMAACFTANEIHRPALLAGDEGRARAS